MTLKDAEQLIHTIIAAYPNYKPVDLDLTINVWFKNLEEYRIGKVAMALKMYILSDTSGFAPSIGQIVKYMSRLDEPAQLNEMEAWSLVAKAIQRSGYYYEEEYAKLPPTIQRAVGSQKQLNMWATDSDLNMEVAKAAFLRSYKMELSREAEYKSLPASIQKLISERYNGSDKHSMDLARNKELQLSSERNEQKKAIDTRVNSVGITDEAKKKLEKLYGDIQWEK